MLWRDARAEKPDFGRRVIVVVRLSNGVLMNTLADYVPYRFVLAEDYMSEDTDPDVLDVGEDGKEYVPEGWWEYTIEGEVSYRLSGDVLYWMPVPKLP